MSGTTIGTTLWKDQYAVPSNLTVLGQWAPTRAFRSVYAAVSDPGDLPSPPSAGDVVLVLVGGIGAFLGHDNELAEWNGSNWVFAAPTEGLYIGAPPTQTWPLLVWDGSTWAAAQNHLFESQLRVVTSATYLTSAEMTQVVVADASGGSFSVYLPAATSAPREYRFHFITGAGKSVTIVPNGTDTINGGGSLIFDNAHNHEHRHVVCYAAGKWACG